MRYNRDELRDMMGLRHQCTVCGDWVDELENEEGECYRCVEVRQLREECERLRDLCHQYYMGYLHNESLDNDCEELWMEGASRHGKLRDIKEGGQ